MYVYNNYVKNLIILRFFEIPKEMKITLFVAFAYTIRKYEVSRVKIHKIQTNLTRILHKNRPNGLRRDTLNIHTNYKTNNGRVEI